MPMTVIIFIIVLAVLILVHELGHFIFAKKTGMRVDEFGIGFPPRIFAFKKGETEYSINLLPLGGFVKIFGENPDEESIKGADSSRSMVNKPRWAQALVISAGVVFNIIFAWVLISIGLMSGLPVSVEQFDLNKVQDPAVVVLDVVKDSPAEKANLQVGDKLLFMGTTKESIQDFTTKQMQEFIASHGGEEITILYRRGVQEPITTFATPVDNILDRPAIGITTDMIGTAKFGFFESFKEGLLMTFGLIASTAVGLISFFGGLITGTSNLSQVTGPVGIAGLAGEAASFGFIYLLSFTAFISINLAVINFIPFPALDGGRLLFIAIESVMRKNIKPIISNSLNLIGFVLLIGMMAVVTYNDILRIF